MSLIDRVHVERRFLRAIRIDTDLGDPKSLDGFICPRSSADVLLTMAQHLSETGQGAFTWTGPYGSGKSSLIVGLSALLNGDGNLRTQATKVFDRTLTNAVRKALPTGTRGWRVLPIVGRRGDPVRIIGEAMRSNGLVARRPRGGWTEESLIRAVMESAAAKPRVSGGLVIFIDEMGKFLESAAQESADVYVFQQLAEAASRSNGRLLIVGVLHQAFEEYANKLSREMRDEWTKIQGRFIDLAVNTTGDEQIDLISRAIESDHRPEDPSELPRTVASILRRDRPAAAEQLATTLESCWPLHPIVACLLGPISRRRFGQNQRSIFGFLNSAETYGFQDFLRRAGECSLYGPDQLWNYLRANLEPSILASPDGHRWALAADALERCESMGGDDLHIRLLKTIAVIDLFKERSGLLPSFALLRTCFPEVRPRKLKTALSRLDGWSLTLFKKFLDAYSIFAGSDFDIDGAVRAELGEVDSVDFARLKTLAGLQPVVAKRHYHETGTLRWFEINLVPLSSVVEMAADYQPENGAIGQLLLAVPTDGETEDNAGAFCREAARHSENWDIVVGISKRAWAIMPLARELISLENVRNDRPELAGDAVARREVNARLAVLQGQVEGELHRAFDSARWYRKHYSPKSYRHADLNSLASDLADSRFEECPRLHNELLNRDKPSGSAVAGQNALVRRMVLNAGTERLGIEGFPAERGLLVSILEETGLYAQKDGVWRFGEPSDDDACRLSPMWKAATDHIERNKARAVSVAEIYDLWSKQPFGIKDGLMLVLVVAFILAQRSNLAAYREGLFRARFDDVDVDYLSRDPTTIQLRWMDLSDVSRRLLSGMAEIVRTLDSDNALVHLEPIDVARGLIGIFDRLPKWTQRTMRLSENAVRFRDLFKRAHDPNKFLFDDVPSVVEPGGRRATEKTLQSIVSGLRDGLEELVHAYPSMLHRLRDIMLTELQVPNLAPQSLAELRDRAVNIQQLAGDFHVEAFVGRIAQFEGGDTAFEGIASLIANKPPRDWVDPDLDRAMVDIAEMAQKFLRVETFTRVKGRAEKRHAMAVVVGMDGRPAPLLQEFQVGDADREAIDAVIERFEASLDTADTSRRNVILAALAELSARYMTDSAAVQAETDERAAS